jgi:hypothetical protein
MAAIRIDPLCFVYPARIMLVQMAGEQNTEIRDETPTNVAMNDYQSRRHLTVTLYESTVYMLRIQLDCTDRQYRDDSLENSCNLAHYIELWIDLNDDGTFKEIESRVYQRWVRDGNAYDLEIGIPPIDGTNTKSGSHRMLLRMTPSSDYLRQCANNDYSETRDYTVNIIHKAPCEGKIYLLINYENLIYNYITMIIGIRAPLNLKPNDRILL